jgi:hypothetical protein
LIDRVLGTPAGAGNRRSRLLLAALALLGALTLFLLFHTLTAGATADEAPPPPSSSDVTAATTGDASASAGDLLPCTGDEQPANFTVYSLGPSVSGDDLASEQRDCAHYSDGEIARLNDVSYFYGSCEILAGANSCAPPLQIQSWPACERNLAMYEKSPGVTYPYSYIGDVRGAPAYSFDGGTRIEVYSSDTTIVIFATDPALAMSALDQIQPQAESQPPPDDPANQNTSGDLPAPDAGSTQGTLTCE